MEGKEIKVNIIAVGIDDAIEKAKRLAELLEEAKSLADEIASQKFELNMDR